MKPRKVLALGNFFSSIHFFLVLYVIAPYLATFLPDEQTGLVISVGAVGTLIAFPFMPKITEYLGSKRGALIVASLLAVALFVLAQQPSFWIAAICLAFICAASPFIQFFQDLLLEGTNASTDETGRVRTAFNTAGNIALILAPLCIGFLLDGGNQYWRVFLVAGISLAPFITLFLFEKLPEQIQFNHPKLLETCKCMLVDKDLRAAALGNLVLQFFYHLAPLYIPLYLHGTLGIAWSELGWMFTVMLLPFVLLEYPAGYIADRWIGDKEMLMGGFVLIGLSFGSLAFVTTATPMVLLLLALIGSRVGAAIVEAMVEGHFFRRVSSADSNTVTLYRMSRPVAALLAPLSASVLLLVTESYLVFFLTSGTLLVLFGVLSAQHVKDIR